MDCYETPMFRRSGRLIQSKPKLKLTLAQAVSWDACLVLVNSDSSPGSNVMLLCSVTASAFCLNDLITHTHKEPKMKK